MFEFLFTPVDIVYALTKHLKKTLKENVIELSAGQ
jgi:hypothetical protein